MNSLSVENIYETWRSHSGISSQISNSVISNTAILHQTKFQDSIELINSFDTTCLDAAVSTQLTPPQSPPQHPRNVRWKNVTNSNINHQVSPVLEPFGSFGDSFKDSEQYDDYVWNGNNPSEVVLAFSQIVDEIVNTRAQELIGWCDSESISSLSPSSMLSLLDESSPLSSAHYYFSDSFSSVHSTENSTEANSFFFAKKRTKVYGRGIEDRKVRKKEQNKNAANRYRQKKRQELERVLREEQRLINRNIELRNVLADRIREAKYLKTLIRELCAKNEE